MHTVIWTVAGQRYAIATRQIVEVVPLVAARPIVRTSAWIRGLMNFRGRLIPLLDMAALLGDAVCEARMACRILVVEVGGPEPAQRTLIGLATQQLVGVEELDFGAETAHPGLEATQAEFLGPVAYTKSGTVQLLYPDWLPGWRDRNGSSSNGQASADRTMNEASVRGPGFQAAGSLGPPNGVDN